MKKINKIFPFCDIFLLLFLFVFVITNFNSFLYVSLALFSIFSAFFIINSILAYLHKNRLNHIYVYSVSNKKNEIELHYQPLFGIHYLNSKDFLSIRNISIDYLSNHYPNHSIVGYTLTLNKINQKNNDFVLHSTFNKWLNPFAILSSLFLTVFNLYNFRTFSLSKKIFSLLFINKFQKFVYKN